MNIKYLVLLLILILTSLLAGCISTKYTSGDIVQTYTGDDLYMYIYSADDSRYCASEAVKLNNKWYIRSDFSKFCEEQKVFEKTWPDKVDHISGQLEYAEGFYNTDSKDWSIIPVSKTQVDNRQPIFTRGDIVTSGFTEFPLLITRYSQANQEYDLDAVKSEGGKWYTVTSISPSNFRYVDNNFQKIGNVIPSELVPYWKKSS